MSCWADRTAGNSMGSRRRNDRFMGRWYFSLLCLNEPVGRGIRLSGSGYEMSDGALFGLRRYDSGMDGDGVGSRKSIPGVFFVQDFIDAGCVWNVAG